MRGNLTAVVPVLDAEDEVGPVVDGGMGLVVVLLAAPLPGARRRLAAVGPVDEGDVEVRVQEDGRGHEEGQHADQGQDQQGLQLQLRERQSCDSFKHKRSDPSV